MRTITIVAMLCGGLCAGGCGSESETPNSVPDPNTAPVADAGPDQSVTVGEPVTLDGSASSDVDDDALTCSWLVAVRPGGSTAELSDPTSEQPSFTPDVVGDYDVQLIVNDGELDSAPDTVTVAAGSVPNTAPVADAGPDQSVTVGDPVDLDGTGSSDVDLDGLTYAWTMIGRPAGSVAELSNPATARPGFTPDLSGDYGVQLIVNDGELDSAPDTVDITVTAPTYAWSAVERIVEMDDVADAVEAVGHPVPVRFDADTIHLYFSGVAFKTWAVVPAYVYRVTSEDDGATWSAPERMTQLEGNYQSYVVGYYAGKLLLVWHDGYHAELHHTALESASDTPAVPTIYVDYETAGREVIGLALRDQTMIGTWHSNGAPDYSPFVGEVGADAATLTALSSPFAGTFSHATLVAPDRAIVLLTDQSLWIADFDGESLAAPVTLPFPEADEALEYGGETLYHAQFEQTSGDIYFTGYDTDRSRSGIYRVRLAD